MWKGIQPKHHIGNKVNEHKSWDVFKWKGVIAAVGPVFHYVNVVFNLGNVLILCTKVETDLTKGLLKRVEFQIGKSGCDARAPTMVDLDDTIASVKKPSNLEGHVI